MSNPVPKPGRYFFLWDRGFAVHEWKPSRFFIPGHTNARLSGVELAKILIWRSSGSGPGIIFTTAFDQFASEGYKLEAIDYLLKPFGYEDFLRGANKALKWAQIKNYKVEGNLKEEGFIYLKVEFQTVKISCNNIIYIEGLKDYAKIHIDTSEKSMLSLITLKALEEKLPKGKFMRIHKSFIVSLKKITSITKNSVFIGKSMFPVSDHFKDEFRFLCKEKVYHFYWRLLSGLSIRFLILRR